MNDPMKEFKEAVEYWDLNITGSMVHGAVHAKLDDFIVMLHKAIENYEKAQTEQNSGLSVEVFEGDVINIEELGCISDSDLSDNIKSHVCGFGEEE